MGLKECLTKGFTSTGFLIKGLSTKVFATNDDSKGFEKTEFAEI